MKNMLFVMNPYAGTRKASKILPEILSVFNRAGYDTRVYITAASGDLPRQLPALADGAELVVCCGGDGTFHETVSGLLSAGLDLPIGYIPAGSTNDFASSLGLSTDPLTAAARIVDGTPAAYDVCRFGDRYFTYVASFGAFSKASYATPQNIKNALGHSAYLLESIHELPQIRSARVRLELDGEVLEDDYLFGAICNSTSIGGILTLDPNQVDMADGLFEILLVRAPRDLTEIPECIMAVQKQQYNCRMITFRSASRVTVRAPGEMDWTLDGEKATAAPQLEITNLHHAIRLIR